MSYSDTQVMLTLASVAYLDETPLPNESVTQQAQRMLMDLNGHLRYGLQQVPTTRDWSVIWVGLSNDDERSNLAFIAKSANRQNTYAVVIRGTDFHLFMDALEDFDVRTVVPFAAGGNIALGASDAFNLLAKATGVVPAGGPLAGLTLLAALTQLVDPADTAPTTLYVTGHSLGGAMTTTLALYLHSQVWKKPVVFQVYTFAAPTAGDAEFAQAFGAAFPNQAPNADSSWRVYNAYDVVPNAWQTVDLVRSYYPEPGPAGTLAVHLLLDGIGLYLDGQLYVQPNAPGSHGAVELNARYTQYDATETTKQTATFFSQLGYQHGCNTYLRLLDAHQVEFQL